MLRSVGKQSAGIGGVSPGEEEESEGRICVEKQHNAAAVFQLGSGVARTACVYI